MSIQAVSSQPSSVLESTFQREDMAQQIAMSVLKQIQGTQQNQAQVLVQMIQQSTPQGTGLLVNMLV